MNEGRPYKHIKVSAASEPDIIIHAGIREDVSSRANANDTSSIQGAADISAQGISAQDAASAAEDSTHAPSVPEMGNGGRDGSYHPTTMADIEGSKMPKTQVAVIIVCVLAIIAFAIWYTFFS